VHLRRHPHATGDAAQLPRHEMTGKFRTAPNRQRLFVYSATSAPHTGLSSLGDPPPVDTHPTKMSNNATIQALQARITTLQDPDSRSSDRRVMLGSGIVLRHPLVHQLDDRALHREGTSALRNLRSDLALLAEGGDRVHRRVDFVFSVEKVNREPQIASLPYRGTEDVTFVSEPVVDLGSVAA